MKRVLADVGRTKERSDDVPATRKDAECSAGTALRLVRPTILCVVFVLSSASAQAHEMRPGYVQIRETTEDVYDVFWKVPARGVNERLSLHLRFGSDVDHLAEPGKGREKLKD